MADSVKRGARLDPGIEAGIFCDMGIPSGVAAKKAAFKIPGKVFSSLPEE